MFPEKLEKSSLKKSGISLAVLAGMVIALFLPEFSFPGAAYDLANHFVPIAKGDFSRSLYPFFMQWFLLPLGWLPLKVAWASLTLLTGLTIIAVSPRPLPVLLSAPFVSCVFIGQIDVIPFIGLLLAMRGSGAGWVMAFSKPQTVLLAMLKAKLTLKAVLVIVLAALASFALYGHTWVLGWINNLGAYPSHQYNQFYVLAPLALLVVFTKKEAPDLLAASAFLSSQYAHWVFLALRPSWLMTAISWSWVLFGEYKGLAMGLLPLAFMFSSLDSTDKVCYNLFNVRFSYHRR